MVLNPRDPQHENVLCRHDELTGTAEAGSVVYLTGDKKVAKVSVSGNVPFGLLGQGVKGQTAGLPTNFEFPGEIGTTDARLGDPVCVYHLGQFDTTHYHLPSGVNAGAQLFARTDDVTHAGKLTNSGTVALNHAGAPAPVAIALSTLSSGEAAEGKSLLIKLLI